MGILQDHVNTQNQILKNWEATGLLQGIEYEFAKQQTAILLENQRLDNERDIQQRDDPGDPNMKGYYSFFRRVSVPIVRRVWGNFPGYKFVSIQAMMAAEHAYFYKDKYNNVRTKALRARTGSVGWIPPRPETTTNEYNNLDAESELCADYSERMAKRIMTEIFRDIREHSKTTMIHEWKSQAHLHDAVQIVMAKVDGVSGGRTPNWIVTSPVLAKELVPEADIPDVDMPRYVGDHIRKAVFSCKLVPEKDILLGFHDNNNPYLSGYFYCPYIPMFFYPSPDDPGPGGHWDYTTKTIYGKGMPFPEFYGRIEVENYYPTDETEGE